MISSTPARARETTQLSFAAVAAFWKASSSRPGTRARVVSATFVIVGPVSSRLRRVTLDCVWIDSGSLPPVPGSSPELRRFEAAFRERFGREPGPYAAVGYEAMRSVLAAIAEAGPRAGSRQAVIDAYFAAAERRGTVLGDYALGPRGQIAPARFTAFRLRRGGADYLP